MIIRVCNIKHGEKFKMQNKYYIVLRITDRIYYRPQSGADSFKLSFGLKSQMKVELT